jgi:hypothetical protein
MKIILSTACTAVLLLAASCAPPASPVPGDGPAVHKVGFEPGFDIATVYASDGDVVDGQSMDAAFELATDTVDSGTQSLHVTGDSKKNRYSADYFVEAIFPTGVGAVDIAGKTFTVAVYVPAGSDVTRVSLTLLTEGGIQTMPHGQPVTAGQWNDLSFALSGGSGALDYFDGDSPNYADITQLRLRFQTTVDEADAAMTGLSVNVDSIEW